jgi:glycosyltransferase involved in cell wall biosynthesis
VQGATLAQYNLVWATSPFSEHSLRNIYRVPAEAIHALPNLVRLQASGRQPSQRQSKVATGELVALLVARLVPTKGVEVALQAMAQLADRALRLRIVGEGDAAYEASLRTLAKDLGVQHRVDFVGAVPPAKLQLEYESADLLVLPSWYEAFGIVLVQAMAAGLPCVASDVGGIPSVVRDGQSGLLFPIGDATALASALRQLEDTNLRERLGTQAQRDAEQFNLETRFDDLMAMYQRAIAASEK